MDIPKLTPLFRRVLEKARGYLVKGWVQGLYAADAEGKACDPWSERAAQWCINGALIRAEKDLDVGDMKGRGVEELLEAKIGGMRLSKWQDIPTRTRSDVLELVDSVLREGK